jgi:hypothetical protein
MTSEAQRFLDALREYFVPAAGPVATGLLGYFTGRVKSRAEAGKIDAEAEQLAINTITESFLRLIEGYEQRITDLTAEITALRDDVRALQAELYAQTRGSSNV